MSGPESGMERGLDRPDEDDTGPMVATPAASMRLRPEPPRVTRLSRKVLVGLGVAAGLGLGGALIFALQARKDRGQGQELYSTDNRATPDGLAGLPKDYSGVPKLGPPLPGDLGRPILNAQTAAQPPMPSIGGMPNPGLSQEEQRRMQESEAARTGRLFAQTSTRPASAPEVSLAASTSATASQPVNLASLGLAPSAATFSTQERQLAFLNQASDKRTISPDRVAALASASIVQAGAVIPAALITGIRSDLPGQITAQVTENVYDSPTGRILLIPQGTRIIGQYDNGIGFGQRRVLLVWNRLIFPNGRSIVLERQPGADTEGYAGLEDGVDYHWDELFKAAVLSTILSVGANAGSSSNSESDLASAIREGASDSISQTGRQIVQRQLNIAPTLTIRPEFPCGSSSRAISFSNPTEADMPKLKLSEIQDDKPVKVTLELPARLHRDLVAYARVLTGETGKPLTDPTRLIAPMLERFIATDRGFAKARRVSDGSKSASL